MFTGDTQSDAWCWRPVRSRYMGVDCRVLSAMGAMNAGDTVAQAGAPRGTPRHVACAGMGAAA